MSCKRKRGVEEAKPSLIMCTTVVDHEGGYPIIYKFEAYPIDKFTDSENLEELCKFTSDFKTVEKLEPDTYFTWEEKGMDNAYEKLMISKDGDDWCEKMKMPLRELCSRTPTPPYCDMCFLNVGDAVYVGGGHKVAIESLDMFPELELPMDFNRFSLGEALSISKVETKELCKMKGKKYVSFMVEVRGLIYVLSRLVYFDVEEPVFEAYDPSHDKWISLPDPPFFADGQFSFPSHNNPIEKLRYMVIGARLYVSSNLTSSIYNTELGRWEVCDLFSDLHDDMEEFFPNCGAEFLPNCGAPFPFFYKFIPYKEKFILATTGNPKKILVAFHINDKGRAVEVPIAFFPQIKYGISLHPLLDLGDDCFIAMIYEDDLYRDTIPIGEDVPDSENMIAVKFKLQQMETGNNCVTLKANIKSMKNLKLSVGSPWKGGVPLDYLCGFIYNPSSSD